MKISELNHAAVHVADVDASVQFYGQVLGLEQIPRPAFSFPGAWFKIGDFQELHIIGERELPVHSHNRGTHFALCVDSMEAAVAQLDACGVEYLAPKQRPDGAWQIFVQDPDGHFVELCDNSPARADERSMDNR